MGEQRFKVGDWVRRVQPSDWPEQYGAVGCIYKVLKVGSYGIAVTAGAGDADATSFEPWQPRVGERVRYTGKSAVYSEKELVGLEGEVSELNDNLVNVKWDKAIVDGIRTGGAKYIENIEPILTAAAPDKPATLKIEAGRFYKTRDGRKVGPMARWSYSAEHPWEQQGGSSVFTKGGDIWRDDGTSEYDVPPLIAEWIDEPVAKPSNDNAQPKFKVGDLIRHKTLKFEGVVKEVVDQRTVRTHWTKEGWGATDPIDSIELITTTTTTTIVALIENGQPKPSSTPHVHSSTGAAETEAKRLAAKFKGKKFGVFTQTATHEEAAPVYDHKWQNMAALGLKIDAIKELRAVAGLTLKGAKDAVEAWIEYENAA
ncbi:hypothetical protein K7A42_03310 [Agrobacterium sp. InxBP2]|uniref:hypothetical protein n=1 Tax=Agrobacterium sp. InxBP2 TaxID=2870329 RepID=UPI00249EE817|nr:hypothetical protein [Agrobacterium sp. InxBP2]MCW8279901.1 hypothetical protein [Agrobacterium sp. InxBP2]